MIDHNLFRRFVPTHVLPPAERAELARASHLVRPEAGKTPFRRGTASASAVFLIDGEVELDDGVSRRRIKAGSDDARHALSNAEQFGSTATCIDSCTLLFVDRARLDYVLAWTQSGTIEVQEIGSGDSQDWMGTMLQCPAMQLIPPANIARVFTRVKPLAAPAGATTIRQGEAGDSYYVLTSGRCAVLRSETEGSPPQEVTTLLPGAGFGEEALLSGEVRNATVRALEDCRLVRLAAADFCELLKAPLLRRVAIDAVPPRALLVDVRLAEEFVHGHLPGAVNLPLRQLRNRCEMLERGRPLAVYCDGGRRSAVGTFLLCERGFDANWIADGVSPPALTEQSPRAEPA
jgi:rhodanese-related sulfurtransferase